MTRISRRDATRTFLHALAGTAFAACGGGEQSASSSGGSSSGGSSGSNTSSTGGSADSWASGGTKSMTAQASYPDPFAGAAAACTLYVDEIFTSHSDYAAYGLPNTHNTNDNVVQSGNVAAFTLTVARMSDGAMLASKQIAANV